MSDTALAAVLGFIFGVLLIACGLEGSPKQICTEAKAKKVELFSCRDVKL